ncbi:adenylate/guanylate cyclase domain-containing protein [Vibrio sagamiensis]|nr:adenylate/guanylate cyclase domain-containing protein [Vibrio sagamiensis]PNQ55595.1 adenylate/guanylate cyclase [Vibrio agarivorans]
MLTSSEKDDLRLIIYSSLDKAEKQWKEGGHLLKANRELGLETMHESVMDSAEPSKIPGHSIVRDGETVIDEFVAFVADMRESSKHLMCAISPKNADVSGLQRVYYETSALLPSLAYVVSKEEGSVTEYLGDGVLALFRLDPENKAQSIYASHRAAKNAIGDARDVINEVLFERYRLPPIDVGVGLAVSKTLITLVGLAPDKQPKAFGECVFRATKLSGGKNEVISDENLKAIWPSSKGGTLKFRRKSVNKIDGYVIGTAAA